VNVNAPCADIQGHAPNVTLIKAGKQACTELKAGKTEADVVSDKDEMYGLNSNILSIRAGSERSAWTAVRDSFK
jgi:Protein of unknown function (DUF732)